VRRGKKGSKLSQNIPSLFKEGGHEKRWREGRITEKSQKFGQVNGERWKTKWRGDKKAVTLDSNGWGLRDSGLGYLKMDD